MNETISTAGACTPIPPTATMKPRVAARLYAGATEAVAHGAGRAVGREIDARDSAQLAAALEGADVLVNSASYRLNLEAMRACLQASCHYLDLGGLYWMTHRQLELGPEFERAGLVA